MEASEERGRRQSREREGRRELGANGTESNVERYVRVWAR